MEVHGLGYTLGAADAPVVVLEFGDFGCSACGKFARETLPGLKAEFIEMGKVRWQYIPILLGGFANAREALRAADCAAEQDAFWPMHDVLYAGQREWQRTRRPLEVLRRYATELGLDAERWQRCYREDRGRSRVRLHNRAARRHRVLGTPTFFVNDARIVGAAPAEQFSDVITNQLAQTDGS